MVLSLLFATVVRTFLVIISYGCKVPAGIFVPSMAIGASFGRMVGILVQALHETIPNAKFFAACEPDVPCITPGTYAFLGAAAALSGIMHITVSVVVIMFELTGALTYILPTMVSSAPSISQNFIMKLSYGQIVVGVTKAVSERFGKGGIADRMIRFNGFPFLDNKEDHAFGVPVSRAMTSEITSLPSSGTTLRSLEQLLGRQKYQGFPIIDSTATKNLMGYIGRTELDYAINQASKEAFLSPQAQCFFTQAARPIASNLRAAAPAVTFDAIESSLGQQTVDFSRFVDPAPLAVHPRLPLETVMELFKKMGPRVIIVEHRGRLVGLVTVKDCLKFQFKFEAQDSVPDNEAHQKRQEKLWAMITASAQWLSRNVFRFSGIELKGRMRSSSLLTIDNLDPRDQFLPIQAASPTGILEGTEEIHEGLELRDR